MLGRGVENPAMDYLGRAELIRVYPRGTVEIQLNAQLTVEAVADCAVAGTVVS